MVVLRSQSPDVAVLGEFTASLNVANADQTNHLLSIFLINDTVANSIRNFLTLFLSIEVTRAMMEAATAKEVDDDAAYVFAQQKVDLFTKQLNESNPLLTKISDAMTKEGMARDKVVVAEDEAERMKWRMVMETESIVKHHANQELMECNAKYQTLMKELREGH